MEMLFLDPVLVKMSHWKQDSTLYRSSILKDLLSADINKCPVVAGIH